MPGCVSNANLPKRKRKLLRNENARLLVWPGLIALVVIILDQVTKLWAVGALIEGESITVIEEFFLFTLVYNYGGAMGTNLGSSTYYLVIAFALIPFVFYYIYHYRKIAALTIPLGFIGGGAIGNIIDRVRLGKVVDFIDVDFFDINLFGFHLDRWWTFNIADAAISCAIVWLVLVNLFAHKQLHPEPINSSPAKAENKPA